MLNYRSDLISVLFSINIYQSIQTESIRACVIIYLHYSQVSVSAAAIDACNGMYHEGSESRCYENNSGGIIYFDNGQWRLTTRELSADGRAVIGMAYATEVLYFANSSEPQLPVGYWSSVDGTGQCKVEASSIEMSCKPSG